MKRKKGSLSTVLIILLMLAGMSLLLYPTVANKWNEMHEARAIASYNKTVEKYTPEMLAELRKQAEEYNRNIPNRTNIYMPSEEEQKLYKSLLNLENDGIMGYVEIPKIKVSLPVYHGTEETVMQKAIGHLEWSYLPVGGEGTHCVLSGHCGLPRAKLFTDLDRLKVGDLFQLHVLKDTLTYEVDQILTVLPNETKDLLPVEGKDLCTLVTCTPYGINTHRLLVRGHRTETKYDREKLEVSSEATLTDTKTVAVFIAVPILLLLFVLALLIRPKKKPGVQTEQNAAEEIPAKPAHRGSHVSVGRKEDKTKRKGGAHVK